MPWPLDPGVGSAVQQRAPASRPAHQTLAFSSRSFARVKSSLTPMRRGRLPHCCCRHVRVDGLERSSGRNASPSGITPSNILSPTRRTAGSWTKVRPGARAHTIRSIQRAHAPPAPDKLLLLERHLTPRRRTSKQQSRCRYRVPCNSGAPADTSRTRGALLLSCTQASVAEFRRQTLAPDDTRSSALPSTSRLLSAGRASVPAPRLREPPSQTGRVIRSQPSLGCRRRC